jgi:hypothetical protein
VTRVGDPDRREIATAQLLDQTDRIAPVGDFRRWKDHDAYKESFERVVRDLTKPKAP